MTTCLVLAVGGSWDLRTRRCNSFLNYFEFGGNILRIKSDKSSYEKDRLGQNLRSWNATRPSLLQRTSNIQAPLFEIFSVSIR